MPNYRNPNGYGSVVKLSGRRRNPYMVRKTVGYDDRAFPVYSIIGYYPTRSAALIALASYNQDPYDVELAKATFSDVYELWKAETFPSLSQSMKNAYLSAYSHCSLIYEKPYKELRKGHLQSCVDSCGKGYSTRSNIKMLFMALDKWAFDCDIINKQYASHVEIGKKEQSKKHSIFTDEEVAELWRHVGEQYVDEALTMLYTGMRISEVLLLKNDCVDFEQNVLIGGMKTDAGKDRIIPIHSQLLPIIQSHYCEENVFLFQQAKDQTTEHFRTKYSANWKKKMQSFGINHLSHDCRHTFRSKLDSAGANRVAIDRIMGHASQTIGERVYTHKTIKELQIAINLLTYN